MKKYYIVFAILILTIETSVAQLKVRSNGFVGVGTTYPYEAFQIGDRWTFLNGGTKVIGYNVTYNVTDKRLVTDYSACIRMDLSGIKFGVAPSGTAGSSISWSWPMLLANNGKVYIGSYYFSNGSWIYSDRNLKVNIKPIFNATNLINNLNGKTYSLKSDDLKSSNAIKGISYGLIAQELKMVIPDLVIESGDSSNSLAINYDGLIPILIEAFKEQKLQIDSLKEEIMQLKSISSNYKFDNIDSKSSAKIFQNKPNPFNQDTRIDYSIPIDSKQADLYICDIQGIKIKKVPISAKGEGSITINSYELKPGMYLYTLIIDGKEIGTRRMILTE